MACRSVGFSEAEQAGLLATCDHWVANDATVQIIQINNMTVTVIIGDDGDYILADTYVTNKSDERILVDPYQSVLFAWKTTDLSTAPERFQPISGQEIASKLKRRAMWANILDSVLTSFARNTTTVTSNSSGSASVYGSGYGGSFSATGFYSGSTTTTISTPDLLARIQSQARVRERDANAANRGSYYINSAMKANTVFAKDSVDGIIYFKRKKAPSAVFTIRVGDVLFDFPSPRPTGSGVGARSTNVQPIPIPDAGFLTGRQTANAASITPSNLTPKVAATASATSNNAPSPMTPPAVAATVTPGETRKSSSGIELAWIPAGSFQMGSTDGEKYEKPVRKVVISEGFWIGKYEVTQLQWFTEMGVNPSDFEKCGGACPVENVSWEDAQRFVARLNARNDGFVYSLPTEAQWEYAARGGTTGKWAGDVKEMAWYSYDSNGRTQPGTKRANAFGLYDMHGNVWEWCSDWYGNYPKTPETDPIGAAKGKYRILRGGSWKDGSGDARSAYRGGLSPKTKYKDIGFRVAARAK
ncbi:MAG: formylglycine-generating enzyme family protein [Pyrinomonadaceae bacterium]